MEEKARYRSAPRRAELWERWRGGNASPTLARALERRNRAAFIGFLLAMVVSLRAHAGERSGAEVG